jgi:mannobiose 2-epimerase
MKHLTALMALALVLGGSAAAPAKELAEHARDYKIQLADKILPYWFDTAQDKEHGGYLLSDDQRGRRPATEKQLVTQTRMIWGFAHAHLKGFSTPQRNYLKAAEQGYRFLQDHFLDPQYGGYYWKTDLAGQATDARKIVYGQSFVIYALVEYYRASGDKEALRRAMALYQTLQDKAHDRKHIGWLEHFQRDWQPILDHAASVEVEVAGCKSANTHLHLMEALAELCEASRDAQVKKSLAEAVRINQEYFYPKNAGQSCFHRQLDWQPVTDPKSAGLSYGHNVEFAWLMVRAQQVLRTKPAWPQFYAHLDHALKYGYDHQRGGLYNRGADDQPATQTDKVWWVQSEMMAALADALKHQPNPAYARALEQLVHFINEFQADPADGIWLDTVTAEGKPKSPVKASSWKANYHDVRGIIKFIEAFPAGS